MYLWCSCENSLIQGNFQSEDVGPHLLAVEDLLQKQSLAELQVTSLGETQRRLGRHAQQYINSGHREVPLLQQRLEQLTSAYDRSDRSCQYVVWLFS